MFKKAPAFSPPDELLHDLAVSLVDDRTPGQDPSDHDSQDNPDITGGYTFLGQFIDHDMTRDTTPLNSQKSDPHAVTNFDTPWFDLQSVYGRGPDLDPQLYESDRAHLAVATPNGFPDLPRDGAGRALIGDPRNDENLIVAQLHVGFLAFHNRLLDEGAELRRGQAHHDVALPVADRQRVPPAGVRKRTARQLPVRAAVQDRSEVLHHQEPAQAVHADRVLRRRLPLRAQHDPP